MARSVTLACPQSTLDFKEGSGHSGPRLQSEVTCFQMSSGKRQAGSGRDMPAFHLQRAQAWQLAFLGLFLLSRLGLGL